MPQQFVNVFAAFGFATAAGLNGWVTLLIVSIAARLGFITIGSPFDIMTSLPVIVFLAVMTLIEGLADKIPLIDHASHVVHTFLQPLAGAILFAAQAGVITDMSPILAFVIGALVSGTIHATRATIRPVVTATTAGIGNPVVSAAEDVAAVTITIGSIIAPILVALAVVAVLIVVFLLWRWGKAASPGSPDSA